MLRKPTEISRVTCTQELRLLVGPEDNAPEGSERNIQLLVPAGSEFRFSIDHPSPLEAGPNRNYKIAVVPSGQTVEFRLQRHQVIYGQTDDRIGEASVIIEYLEGE